MARSDALLTVDNINYDYADRRAVDDVSFDVRKGEIFGLLGPNGAGKTTTISCIAGLLKDWTGTMTFSGQAFAPAEVVEDRRRLGFVPQELAIYPDLTARENLVFFGQLLGLARSDLKESVDRNLEIAGLTERRNDRVRTFSGGMQRRLNLAVGLLNAPELLLLDEPTVGVDPQSRNHLFDMLQKLNSEGMSLLYTTHYMEEAQRLCSRIAIMNESRIMAVGSAAELAAAIDQPGANLETVFLEMTGRKLRDE